MDNADRNRGPSWADLDQTDLRHVEQDLAGRQCRMQANGRDWFLELGDDRRILVSAPWRIISDGRIAFGSEDEGKWFGLAEPLSGRLETGMLLTGKGAEGLSISLDTADLTLKFEGGARIDIFNHSSGYEGWRIHCQIQGQWVSVIGAGGGHARISSKINRSGGSHSLSRH